MPLPIAPLGTETIVIAGTSITVRSLSRDAVVRLSQLDTDQEAAEVLMLVEGTGITDDDAREWRRKVDAKTADELLEAIASVSGLRRRKGPGGKA